MAQVNSPKLSLMMRVLMGNGWRQRKSNERDKGFRKRCRGQTEAPQIANQCSKFDTNRSSESGCH